MRGGGVHAHPSMPTGERVFMHYRRLANPNYTTVSIPVTAHQEAMARR